MSAASNAGRVGVWGRSGSGKSSYVKHRIRGQGRVIVFDPLDEYRAEACTALAHSDGGLDPVRAAMRAKWAGFRLAYVPPAGYEPAALSALSRLLMAAQEPFRRTGKGMGITLVVEEMNLAFPTSGGVEKAKGFADICSRGRHYGITIIGVSQRIAEVATRFRGNCTETVVFAQRGPRDLAAAASELGLHSPDRVRGLDSLAYLHERNGTVAAGNVTFARGKAKISNLT